MEVKGQFFDQSVNDYIKHILLKDFINVHDVLKTFMNTSFKGIFK